MKYLLEWNTGNEIYDNKKELIKILKDIKRNKYDRLIDNKPYELIE